MTDAVTVRVPIQRDDLRRLALLAEQNCRAYDLHAAWIIRQAVRRAMPIDPAEAHRQRIAAEAEAAVAR